MASVRSGVRGVWRTATMMIFVAIAAPMVFGQFGLPKVKVPKIGKSTPAEKGPQVPTPVVTTITPGSVPAGWEGEVVFTGTNFSKGMKLRLECGNQSMKVKDFRVENAERAVFTLKVPPSLEESKCVIALEVPPGGGMGEISPTAQGTPQVVQVTGPTLSISESSNLAKAYKACFLAEGDIPPMQLMGKLAQAMQGGSQDECKLLVSADAVKYSAQGKTILDQPASGVKTVEQILMMGNPTGAFRIVLTSGKIYNFFATGSQDEDNPLYEQIKKKLGK